MKQIKELIQPFLKKKVPDIKPGDTVKVYQKVKEEAKKKGEEAKEKIQTFEGIVIAKKHGKEIGATITVRKVISGIGVERIFPLHLPSIDKIEVLRRSKTRRAKLYFLRTAKGKRARLKRKDFVQAITEEPKKQAKEAEEIKEKPETTESSSAPVVAQTETNEKTSEQQENITKEVPQKETKA